MVGMLAVWKNALSCELHWSVGFSQRQLLHPGKAEDICSVILFSLYICFQDMKLKSVTLSVYSKLCFQVDPS